jgi:hypothetical protein
MATCDPSALIATAYASGLMALSEKELDMATVALLQTWSGNTDSPNQLLGDAKCFNCLDTKQIDMIQTQLLCDIAG